MHSFLSRANAISAYTLSVLACLTFLCFLSTLFNDYKTKVDISVSRIYVKNVPNYGVSREMNDLGHILIDLETDLSPLFNWNVKQLFLYLAAEYETESNKLNQIVLWDKIVKRGDENHLKYKNLKLKYYFWDDGNGLRGNKNVTLTLWCNIIPNAGLLPHISMVGEHSFQFPKDYTTIRTPY